MELFNQKADFTDAPAFEVYAAGAEELAYHRRTIPVSVRAKIKSVGAPTRRRAGPDRCLAKTTTTKISSSSFPNQCASSSNEPSAQALSLEKGMIILSTAVAGGPFIGLLGTVWGVMETFSGIAIAKAASLTAIAPGVAGALIATVVGLFVAIPAMFAYNYMITMIRGITQELDNFNSEFATAIEHVFVDNRSVADEVGEVLNKPCLSARLAPAPPKP